MKKTIKKIAVYATMTTLGLSTLTGCGSKKVTSKEKEENAKTQEFENLKEKETRVFEPYTHMFFIRNYNLTNENAHSPSLVTGGSIDIPEGYEVFTIENYTETGIKSAKTGGYDVWYVNTVPVEVEEIYNKSIGKYDYSNFGTPVSEKTPEMIENKQKIK